MIWNDHSAALGIRLFSGGDHRFLQDHQPEHLTGEETWTRNVMSRLYNRRQKDADEAHRIQVKAGLLVSRLWMLFGSWLLGRNVLISGCYRVILNRGVLIGQHSVFVLRP